MKSLGPNGTLSDRPLALWFLVMLWVSAPVGGQASKDATKLWPSGIAGSEQAVVRHSPPLTCYDYSKYFVIEAPLADSLDSNILVKYKRRTNQSHPCSYRVASSDFELKNASAAYFFGIVGDLMFLDSGTCPCERGLTVYSLSQRRQVYRTVYLPPVKLTGDHQLSLWQEVRPATEKDCRDYKEFEGEGLVPTIEAKFVLDLIKFTLTRTGQTRCEGEQ